MAIPHNDIFDKCKPILEAVGYHITKNKNERRFITAYQVWDLLQKQNKTFSQQLKDECRVEKTGKNAGDTDNPVQRISQALGRRPENIKEIETRYLDTRFLAISEIIPGGKDCGLFRLRG